MSRIRTVKPEFWRHEDLSAQPEATHLLAAALLNYADDEGYFNANPLLVKAECCPLREPSVSIHCSLKQLQKIGFIALGKTADGKSYGHIVKFAEHQRVNRPSPSKIKQLGIVWEGSRSAHPQFSEPSPPERNREQGTGNREQGTGNREDKGSDPNGSGAADAPPDIRTVLFRDGLAAMKRMTGKPESGIRSLLGRWLKLTGDDCRAINDLIAEAERDRRADPAAWIEARLRGPPDRDPLMPAPYDPAADPVYDGVQNG